jgi:RHS repeat-associated protein
MTVTDADGSLTTSTWDFENMCTGIVLPSGSRNTFTYAADLKRRSAEDAAGLVRFVHDGENVLLETDGGGETQVSYTLEPSLRPAGGPVGYGNLISQRRGSTSSWHHFDALGSTDRLTDASESELASYVQTAFGVPKAATGSHPNRLRWMGRLGYRWEPDAGQYDVRRRRYEAGRGRWTSRDALVAWGERYGYGGNSPIRYMDPSGLAWRVGRPSVQPPANWADAWAAWNTGDTTPSAATGSELGVYLAFKALKVLATAMAQFPPGVQANIEVADTVIPVSREGARGYVHYCRNTGALYEIDFCQVIREHPGIFTPIIQQECRAAKQFAETVGPGSWHIVGDEHPLAAEPYNPNWGNLLGSEQTVVGTAFVLVRSSRCREVRFYLELYDWWLWARSDPGFDAIPGRFHKEGLAKFFPMYGDCEMPCGSS